MRRSVFLITCLFLTLTVASHAIPSLPVAVDDNYYTDSGATVALLGLAMIGLGVVGRRLA